MPKASTRHWVSAENNSAANNEVISYEKPVDDQRASIEEPQCPKSTTQTNRKRKKQIMARKAKQDIRYKGPHHKVHYIFKKYYYILLLCVILPWGPGLLAITALLYGAPQYVASAVVLAITLAVSVIVFYKWGKIRFIQKDWEIILTSTHLIVHNAKSQLYNLDGKPESYPLTDIGEVAAVQKSWWIRQLFPDCHTLQFHSKSREEGKEPFAIPYIKDGVSLHAEIVKCQAELMKRGIT